MKALIKFIILMRLTVIAQFYLYHVVLPCGSRCPVCLPRGFRRATHLEVDEEDDPDQEDEEGKTSQNCPDDPPFCFLRLRDWWRGRKSYKMTVIIVIIIIIISIMIIIIIFS